LSDHFPIFLIFKNFESSGPKHTVIEKRQVNEIRKTAFTEQLSNTDWSEIYAEQDTNKSYNLFLEKFLDMYNKTFPIMKRKVKHTSLLNPWFTKGFLRSSKMKQKLYNKYLKSKADKDHEKYRHYKNLFEKLKIKAKESYYKNKITQYQSNAKKTWDVIKEILGKQKLNAKKLPNNITVNGQDIFEEKSIATHFNKFFVNVGPNLAAQIKKGKTRFTEYLLQTENWLQFSELTTEELDKAFTSLQRDKSPGHDGISSNIISGCYVSIRNVLCDIFKKSLNEGTFPDKLKIAKVVPIFKNDDPTEFSNYRPISILPVFSKLLERIIYNRIYDHLRGNNLFYEKQFGFQKNSSTEHALLQLVEDITKSFEQGSYTLGVFIDLSKAFDTVDHKILFAKLRYYGISGKYYEWICSYLTNRKQYVTYQDNRRTTELHISCLLGPLLFLLYVNDLYRVSKVLTPIMFADDTNLFYSHKNLNVLYNTVNMELLNINEWFKANKLSLNIKKTTYTLFHSFYKKPTLPQNLPNVTIDGAKVERKQVNKFLGILVDENLSWNQHVDYIENKISKNIGILYKTRHILDKKSLTQLYFSFIHSYLTHKTKMYRLLKKQKHAARIIHFKNRFYHSQPLLENMKALNVLQLNLFKHLCFIYQYREGKTPKAFENFFTVKANKYSTRSRGKYYKPFYKTNSSRFAVSYRGPNIWNSLPFINTVVAQAENYDQFKNLTKTKLLTFSLDEILKYF